MDGRFLDRLFAAPLTIRQKILAMCATMVVGVLGLLVFQMWAADKNQTRVGSLAALAQTGLDNSQTVGVALGEVNQKLTELASQIKERSSQLQTTHQHVTIVSRKIANVSDQLTNFSDELTMVMEQEQDQERMFALADLADELGDIKLMLDREAVLGLKSAQSVVADTSVVMQNHVAMVDGVLARQDTALTATQSNLEANRNIETGLGEFSAGLTTNSWAVSVVLMLVLVVVVGGLSLISVTVLGPLTAMREMISNLSEGQGDLTRRIPQERADEFGELAAGVNRFIEQLQQLVIQVQAEAGELQSLAVELTSSSSETASAVLQEQQRIEDMSHAIQELSQTAASTNQSINEAAKLSRQTDNEAKQGSEMVQDSISFMASLDSEVTHAAEIVLRLEQDSQEIGKVLEVIYTVAAQTNLLALNAAIEAARAGEQGRGFAVVADEVRALANRTHDATEEIQDIIIKLNEASETAVKAMQNSQSRVSTATDTSHRVGGAFKEIEKAVDRIRAINADVSSAAEVQSGNASSVAETVQDIYRGTEETSERARHLKQTSQQVDEASRRISETLGRFKVDAA